MRKIIRIFRMAVIVILYFALFVNVMRLTKRLGFHQELPRFLGFSQVDVLSGSMEPTFSAGDMLVFQKIENYKINDIVIFKEENSFITHRIVAQAGDDFVTKGDANNIVDAKPLDPDNIYGRLFLRLPKVGGFFAFLRTRMGCMLVFGVGLLLMGTIDFSEFMRKREGTYEEGETGQGQSEE